MSQSNSVALPELPQFELPTPNVELPELLEPAFDVIAKIDVDHDEVRQSCVESLKQLRGCDVHITHIPTPGDETGLRRLGVHLTSDPVFATKNLFTS